MLIAEDLLLLLYDDETGKAIVDRTKLDNALAGAVLIDMALLGRIDVAEKGENVRKGRLVVRDPSPLDDEILADAAALLAAKEGRKPSGVVGRLSKGLRERLLDRLTERGILRREDGKILGIFPTSRWPAEDVRHESGVRDELHAALVLGRDPSPRTAALIALLHAIDAVPRTVDAPDRKALKRRTKEIAEGAWAADAVRSAVQATQAAVTAAVTAATITATSSGG